MTDDRSVTIGKDAEGNIIVTGDGNHVYVFHASPSDEVLQALKAGKLNPEDIPEAVPLPTLTLQIAFTDADRKTWTVTSSENGERTLPVPWSTETNFGFFLETFWKLTGRALEGKDEHSALTAAAVALGSALRDALAPADADLLITRARGDGPPPLLVIESDDDLILAFPWELIRLEEEWSVRDGKLDLARTVPAEGAPHLEPPIKPVSLLMNVSAPKGSGLSYEEESYHVTRALHDHVGVRVNEMGELDDLVRGLSGDDPPIGVHFSGHGGHGTLVFEDELGEEDSVAVEEMLTKIDQAAPKLKPRFFYLACCHGNSPPSIFEKDAEKEGSVTSTAALLHRGGVAQIVAHFGPVYDKLSTSAETAFYCEIAKGRRTRDAVRAARTAMALPYHPTPREVQREADGGGGDGVSPFAWAQLVLYHRGPDYPLGLPITRIYADAVRAQVARHVEGAFPGARTQVLRAGFIGRRSELHTLRRDLKEERHIHVVQGLGGLGKSAFCQEARKIYRTQGRHDLALWCADVEQEHDPVASLERQFSAECEKLVGEVWGNVIAAVDKHGLERPSERVGAFLGVLLQQMEGIPPLVLYLDNLESLFVKPGKEDYDPKAVANWRDAEAAALWATLVAVAQRSGGRLALLASCRYRHRDFADFLFPFGPMPGDTVFRLMQWYPSLRQISDWSLARLIAKLDGHPRSVEFLDPLIKKKMSEWTDLRALRTVGTQEEAQREWKQFIAPALPTLADKLREDLLFTELWNHVLNEHDQRLLVHLTVLIAPADTDLVLALCDPKADEGQKAASIRRLRDASLLTELRTIGANRQERLRFDVHRAVAEFACDAHPKTDDLRREACHLAGDFLEARAKTSKTWDDPWAGGHYLFEVQEYDRAWGLWGDLCQWLQGRQRHREAFALLDRFHDEQVLGALNLRNSAALHFYSGDYFVYVGDLAQASEAVRLASTSYEGLARAEPNDLDLQRISSVALRRLGSILLAQGQTDKALDACRQALAIAERLARQDPGNAAWQRDLSASHEKIGNVLIALGKTDQALDAYRKDLAIAERLAKQDPGNAGWQRDLSVSHNKIGDVLIALGQTDQALDAYQQGLAIIERLTKQDPGNAGWQRDLFASHIKIGNVLIAGGRSEQGLDAYRQGLGIIERLAHQDPANAECQRDLAGSHCNIGTVLIALGKSDQALDAYRRSLSIRERLAKQDPGNAQWQGDLAVTHSEIGDVLIAAGKTHQALDAYRQALAIRERLAKQDPGNAGWQRGLAVSYHRLATVAEAAGDSEEAGRHWDLCRATLQSMKDRGMYLDPPVAALLAKLEKKAE